MKSDVLRVYHAATFSHNIGDGALVAGIRAALSQDLDVSIQSTEDDVLEGKLQGKTRALTAEMVDRINESHDLVLIGGGGMMEGGKENRLNGLNYGFDPECLRGFRIPVVFYAMGFNRFRGKFYHHLGRLRETLTIARNMGMLVSVRNDHSKKRLEEALGSCPHVEVIPDPGLWVPAGHTRPVQLVDGRVNVVLQLAGDQVGSRFPRLDRWFSVHRVLRRRFTYLGRLARALEDLGRHFPLNLIMCPHIPADHLMAGRFFAACTSPMARRLCTSSGMMKGVSEAPAFFDLYRGADVVVGMRGHSVICSVGVGTPCVGISSHDKVKGFLDEIGLPDWSVEMSEGPDRVVERLQGLLDNLPEERRKVDQVRRRLRKETRRFHEKVAALVGKEVRV